MSLYQNRIVAYVDIIGWSDACRHNEELAFEAARAIRLATGRYSAKTKEEIKSEAGSIVHPLFYEFEMGAFSDNLVISTPAELGIRILLPLSDLCRRLLRLGFLTRGGVTAGNLFHLDNMVYGPALIDAVELEKEACYPRILCADGFFRACETADQPQEFIENFSTKPVIEDCLGRRVVNIFDFGKHDRSSSPLAPSYQQIGERWGIGQIFINIDKGIEVNTDARDLKRLEKWSYAKDLMNRALREAEVNKN